MFLTDRKEVIGKNDYYISDVSQILDELSTMTVIGETGDLQTIKAVSINNDTAIILVNKNTIKIININGEKCNVKIQKFDDVTRVVNKDIDLDFSFLHQYLESGIEKIAIVLKHNKNEINQAYIKKNDDVILIAHREYIDSSNIAGAPNGENLEVLIKNSGLIGKSEDEIVEIADECGLGMDDDEQDINDDNNEEEDIDEDIEEDIDEEDIEEEEVYLYFEVEENGKTVDVNSAQEMIEDLYDEICEETQYLDEDIISSVDVFYNQVMAVLTKNKVVQDDVECDENDQPIDNYELDGR